MLVTRCFSNGMLLLLQRPINATSASMCCMHSVTKYVVERRWCPRCLAYQEDAVTVALPRHRLGLHVLLFVVYQKAALGLSYSKIQHELHTYFGLTMSAGEPPSIVAEIATLFGQAYARLLNLLRQQAAIHVDETSWRVDGVPH